MQKLWIMNEFCIKKRKLRIFIVFRIQPEDCRSFCWCATPTDCLSLGPSWGELPPESRDWTNPKTIKIILWISRITKLHFSKCFTWSQAVLHFSLLKYDMNSSHNCQILFHTKYKMRLSVDRQFADNDRSLQISQTATLWKF